MKYGRTRFIGVYFGADDRLKNDGTYVLSVEMKNGKTRKSAGDYEVNGETIAFIDKTKKHEPRRVFSRRNDEIEVVTMLHGKTLFFLFTRAS